MPQTSVNSIGQPVAFAGLISDNYQAPDLVSGFSEDTNPIPFGVAVKQGAAPAGCLNLTACTSYFGAANPTAQQLVAATK